MNGRFQFNAIMIIIIFFVAFAQHIRYVGGRHGVELVDVNIIGYVTLLLTLLLTLLTLLLTLTAAVLPLVGVDHKSGCSRRGSHTYAGVFVSSTNL
jgi:hypothetical protein